MSLGAKKPFSNVIIMAVMVADITWCLKYPHLLFIFQIFLKVAEESGVDAETSGSLSGVVGVGATHSLRNAFCMLS